MLRYILALILLMSPMGALRALTEECASALKTLFAQEVDAEEAGEFLRLQGDITMHRLAWTYLKAQKDDQDTRLRTTENTILDLLDQKYTNSNPEFIKARKAFEEQPLSRAALAEIGPFLKEAMG